MSEVHLRAPSRSWLKKAAFGAATGALLAASPGLAAADPATDAKLQALEDQVQALSAQISDLKASTASDVADVRAAAAAQPQVTLDNGRPTFTSSDGKIKFAVRALAQFDATHYSEDNKGVSDLNSGTNFRRARLGIEGTYAKDWSYAITGEYGGSGAEAPVLNQAYVEYSGFKPGFLANPVRWRIGAWAQPANLEDATNNTESLFLERPAASEINRGLAAGDGRSGFGFNANGDRWFASATVTGDVVGQGSATATTPISDEQTGYLARAAYEVFKGPNHAVHIGANVSGVVDPQDTGAGVLTTKSLRLRERPELRVDDTRLVDTGAISANGLISYGAELGANWKNLYVAGEYIKIDVDRTATGAVPVTDTPNFDGWYVQGAWTITGEQHQWAAATGGFRGIRPAKSFNPAKGEWGAWELAGRYSVLNLNYHDNLSTAAGGIRGGEQKISTVGLNFYPNSVVRFLLDYEHADVNKIGAVNNSFDAVSLRSQFAF